MRVKKKVLSTIIGWLVAFIIVFFLMKTFLAHWSQVKTFHWNVNYWYLFASIPFIIFIYFWNAFVFHKILKIQGLEIEYKSVFKIVTISSLGAYVPGKVWGVVGLTYFTKKNTLLKNSRA